MEGVEEIVRDLRAFSGELLERGAAPMAPAHIGSFGARGTSVLLRYAERVTALVPSLLDDLELDEGEDAALERPVPVPRRARLSKSPADYEYVGQRLLPRRWLQSVVVYKPPEAPLRWLTYVLQGIDGDLCSAVGRYDKWFADARSARGGESEFAKADDLAFDSIATTLRGARRRLAHVMVLITRYAGGRMLPSNRMPAPFPRPASWRGFRRLAQQAEARHQVRIPTMSISYSEPSRSVVPTKANTFIGAQRRSLASLV